MASVDDRVVAMHFNNAQFEAAAKQSMSTLDKLKASLNMPGASKGLTDVSTASDKLKRALHMPGAAKGLQDVQTASKNVQLGHIASGVESLKQRFSTLSVVGTAALATLTTKAAMAGANIAKSLTISPVTDGFREYETQLNAVQTILANTQAAGTNLQDVNRALRELNEYSDKTIYNFTEMTRNIGTFTAAGVDLKTATGSIKGIANLAALSGSNSQQASTAMYQLSQAISAGRVSLQDWNSVVNAGMGGTVFQRALAQTAQQMGTLSDGAVKLKGKMKNVTIEGQSFRQSIQGGLGKDSWLTSEVLTKTLQQFTGDLSDAELAAMGFSKAQIQSIQATAKTAEEAATKVKTLSQLFSTARETAGSGWAQTWQLIFGDFEQARSLFTGASEALSGFINKSAEARNKVLGDWAKLGGRLALIEGIKNVFEALGSVLKPIKQAFRDIFPAQTGKSLYDLTLKFFYFSQKLKLGSEAAENLKRTFRGVFAVFSIVGQVIKAVLSGFGKLIGASGDGAGGFLDFTGSIGDFLTSIDKALKKSGALTEIFSSLAGVLSIPIKLLGGLASAFSSAFESMGAGGTDGFTKVLDGIASGIDYVMGLLNKLGDSIASALGQSSFNGVLDVIRTVLLGGIAVMISKFVKGGIFGGKNGLIASITGPFDQLTATLKSMQQEVQAKTLLMIAGAVALLTASVVALSGIDSGALSKALAAMSVGFAQLLAAMAVLMKISVSGGFLKVPFIAASLILLASAVNVMVLAVRSLSKLSWEELAKGLSGVAVLLGLLVAAAGPLSASSAGMIRAGVGILAVSIGLKVLASAVKDFGSMDWGTIGKGLLGVSAALIAVGVAMMFVPPNIAVTGAGIVAAAIGLKLLASAIKSFGNLDLATMAKGLGFVVASIIALGIAVTALPKTLVLQAAGLMLLSVALTGIAGSIAILGNLSLGTLVKGLTSLAVALGILAVGLALMQGSLGGSAALIVAAAALAILVPPLVLLGKQSWGSIIKGMISLAGAFVLLGAAGILLAPLTPALIGLGAAMVLVGAGMALLGGGVALLAMGLSSLAITGPAGIAILVRSFTELIKVIPVLATQLALGLIKVVETLAQHAPAFAVAVGKILVSMANAVIMAAPRLAQAFAALVVGALGAISKIFPRLVSTGVTMVVSLLRGVANNIGRITTAAANLIINFLNALTRKLPSIIEAGVKMVVAFAKGLVQNMAKVVKAAADVVAKFLNEVAKNAPKVIEAGATLLAKLLKGIADNLGKVTKAAADVISKLVKGIGDGAGRVVRAATSTMIKFTAELGRSGVRLAKAAGKIILEFLQGIKQAVDQYAPQITQAGIEIGIALCAGVARGIAGAGKNLVKNAVSSLTGAIPGWVKKPLGISSPSKVMIPLGINISEGLALGITYGMPQARAASEKMAYDTLTAAQKKIYNTSMTPMGEYLADTFKKGLLGPMYVTKDDLDVVFDEAIEKVQEQIDKAREAISIEKEAQKGLRDRKRTESKAYKDSLSAVKAFNAVIKDSSKLRTELRTGYVKEKADLKALTKEYLTLTDNIRNAESALQAAIDLRDNAAKNYSDKYSVLPDIVSDDPEKPFNINQYIADLAKQASAVEKYKASLDQLKAMGLNDALYTKLLEEGTAGQVFADQLISGGPAMVNAINGLSNQLTTSAQTLGSTAATNLYQAGVQAAEGLLLGLKAREQEIIAAMNALAEAMLKATKKKLKIKSPSKEFAKIGTFSAEGMAYGLKSASNSVVAATESVGDAALAALRASMSSVSDLISEEIDATPVIAPVLDLSNIQTEAKKLSDLTTIDALAATASYQQASAISTAQAELLEEIKAIQTEPKVVKFEQNNYSPESLSAAEIYRQTNNQLSKAKAVLTN